MGFARRESGEEVARLFKVDKWARRVPRIVAGVRMRGSLMGIWSGVIHGAI